MVGTSGRLQWAFVFICALGFSFDLFEMGLGGALATVFSAPPNALPPLMVAWLLSSVFIGAIVGAPAFGVLADKRGRRVAMVSALVLLGVMSLFAASSKSTASLILFRGASGLGLGGFPPVLMAYLTDVIPAARRGKLLLYMSAVALAGTTAGIFTVRGLTVAPPLGIEAWRWGVGAGGVGAVLCAALFMLLPESPAWIASRAIGTGAGNSAVPSHKVSSIGVGDIRGEPKDIALPLTKRLQLFAVFLLSPWATSTFPMVLGALLIAKGFKLTDSLTLIGISTLGPIVGTLFVALKIDLVRRKTTLIASSALMAVFAIGFAATDVPAVLLALATGFYFAAVVFLPTLNIYAAEMVSPQQRGRLVSSSWACNRVGAALSPLLILPLAKSNGPMAVVAVVVASLVATIVLLATSAQERKVVTGDA